MSFKQNILSERKIVVLSSFIFLFLIVFSNLGSSVPPVTNVQQFTEGYDIRNPLDNVIKAGQSYEFEFHIFNISNGKPVFQNVSCYFHLYDQTGENVVVLTDATADTQFDYGFNVNGNNFTKSGDYYYNIQCNSSNLGGYNSAVVTVTPNGLYDNLGFFILIIVAIYTIAFVGFFGKNEWVSILGGMAMISLGIYMITNGVIIYRDFITEVFSWTTIGIGTIFSLLAGISIIQENL